MNALSHHKFMNNIYNITIKEANHKDITIIKKNKKSINT